MSSVRFLACLAFAGLLAVCTPPPRYYANAIHPERDFEIDKYDCASSADARTHLVYPEGITFKNMNYYNLVSHNYLMSCLHSRGWQEVEK
jgi:hypothetical protein